MVELDASSEPFLRETASLREDEPVQLQKCVRRVYPLVKQIPSQATIPPLARDACCVVTVAEVTMPVVLIVHQQAVGEANVVYL